MTLPLSMLDTNKNAFPYECRFSGTSLHCIIKPARVHARASDVQRICSCTVLALCAAMHTNKSMLNHNHIL